MTTAPIFEKTLVNGPHVRSFQIQPTSPDGWIASEEADQHVVQRWRYTDWHRVERAVLRFRSAAAELRRAGWIDVRFTPQEEPSAASS
jgi:hypothetical protein